MLSFTLWIAVLTALPARADRRTPPVRVMIVPHSHEDPGWTQTIDEYYNGCVDGLIKIFL